MTEGEESDVAKMRGMIDALVSVSREIDEKWKQGFRSMPTAETHAIATGTVEMFEAILREDAVGFQKAANTVRETAFRAVIHARNWVKTDASLAASQG